MISLQMKLNFSDEEDFANYLVNTLSRENLIELVAAIDNKVADVDFSKDLWKRITGIFERDIVINKAGDLDLVQEVSRRAQLLRENLSSEMESRK